MKAKEYLHQAYRLDKRIQSNIEEMERLRELSTSVSSPSWGERIQTQRHTDALFVRYLERIEELQIKINDEVDHLVALKAEIWDVINKVTDIDERMVLRYRYVHNFTWEQIGDELNADKSTIRRWHGNALNHVIVPENPITIQKLNSNEHFWAEISTSSSCYIIISKMEYLPSLVGHALQGFFYAQKGRWWGAKKTETTV